MSNAISTGGSFPGVQQHWHEPDHPVPRLRMSGPVPPLPHMPSLCAQGKFHLLRFIYVIMYVSVCVYIHTHTHTYAVLIFW